MALAEVTIKETCMHGGKAGKVMLVKLFPLSTSPFFWVIIPDFNPSVGVWYKATCLDITEGELPKPPADNTTYRHLIKKGDNSAYFNIDKATKDSFIAEGFTVTYAPE